MLSSDDLDATVEAAVAGRFENTGQACNAAKRFMVAADIYFVERSPRPTTPWSIVSVGRTGDLDREHDAGVIGKTERLNRKDQLYLGVSILDSGQVANQRTDTRVWSRLNHFTNEGLSSRGRSRS